LLTPLGEGQGFNGPLIKRCGFSILDDDDSSLLAFVIRWPLAWGARIFGWVKFVPPFHQVSNKFHPGHGANPLGIIGPAILCVVQEHKAIGLVDARYLEFSASSLVASGVLGHVVIFLDEFSYLKNTTVPLR
jgi:hypothetical protein